jgi:hypothetical protein
MDVNFYVNVYLLLVVMLGCGLGLIMGAISLLTRHDEPDIEALVEIKLS